MSALRGGLYGCGMISEFHLRGWTRIPEVEIVALANRTIERAEVRRKDFAPSARVYGGLDEMLAAENLDFVDILTPPYLHAEHCMAAAEAGVHVICQKPLCETIESARSLVESMRGYPKLFAVHENHRYRPWFQVVAERAREGRFGEIVYVRLEQFDAAAPAERYKLEAERGVLLEYGTHLVDMVRCLLGEPSGCSARLHRAHPEIRGESLAHVVFEYPTSTAVIDVGWKEAGIGHGTVLVLGTRGEAYYEGTMTRGTSSRFRVIEDGQIVLDEARSPMDDYVESFYLFERAFADAMLSGTDVEQTAAENLRTLEAAFAAYETGAVIERGS